MTTYIEIVNKLCRRLNEVEIPEDQFDSVIGVQAMLKDGIIDTLDMIFQTKYKWPFLATEATVVMTPSDQEYAWPADFLSVDWKSFRMVKDDVLGVRNKTLKFLNREEWYAYYRDDDYDSNPSGRNLPEFVFNNHGLGWGISPNPDRAYTINYKYFRQAVRPEAATDVIDLPQEYEYLLIQGGLMHGYLFLDNNERSTIAEKRRDDALRDMSNTLLGNQAEHMYAGTVNQTRSAKS